MKVDNANGHKFVADDDEELKVPTYTHMKTVLTFQQLPYSLADDADVGQDERGRYVQVMPSVSEISYLSLPGGIMEYIVDGGVAGPPATPRPHTVPVPYPIGMPVPTLTIKRKWHRVPLNCWGPGTALYTRVFGDAELNKKPFAGTVNAESMFGYPPGYLLYLGIEESIEFDPLGDELCWSLTHTWSAKTLAPHTWLYFFSTLAADASANGWYYAAKRGSTYSTVALMPDETGLFNSRQHHLLFQVG